MVGSNSNSNSNGHGNGSRASGVGKSEQSRGSILNDYRGDRDRDRDKDKDRHHDDYVSHGKEQQQSKPYLRLLSVVQFFLPQETCSQKLLRNLQVQDLWQQKVLRLV